MIRALAVSTGTFALAALAAAGTPDVDVIFTRALTSPTATVPGAVDANGAPVMTQFAGLSAFYLSPDGTRWMLQGTTTQVATESAIMLAGSGLSGTMLLQEARPFPGSVGGEVVDFFSSTTSPFNDNGGMLVSLRARGGAATVFHKLVRFSAMGDGVAYQMGDAYIGMQDLPPNPSGDETIGNSPQSGVLLNDNTVGWRDDTVVNLHSTRRPVTAFNAVKHLQEGDTVTALDGVNLVTLQNIGSAGTITVLWASPDGSRIVVRGNTTETGTPQIVVVDGQVRIQTGQAIPGSAIVPSDINATFVAGNNDWYARGVSASVPWATRNGVVIAQGGDAVGSDAWATATFFAIAGNTNGDWLVAGKTTNPDLALDDVIVVNGEVVLREGDPVTLDLDGDGMLDDTAFIGRGNNTLASFVANSVYLAPDKTVYALANLRDGAGVDLGGATALIRVNVGGGCLADFDGNGTREVPDIFAFLSAWFAMDPSADFDGVPGIAVPDIFAFLSLWFAGC